MKNDLKNIVEMLLKIVMKKDPCMRQCVNKDGAKAISAYDLENNFIKSFISLREAAKWIINNNLTSSYQIDKIAYNISRAVD